MHSRFLFEDDFSSAKPSQKAGDGDTASYDAVPEIRSYEAGFDDGYKAAKNDEYALLTKSLQQISSQLRAIEDDRASRYQAFEKQILAALFDVIRHCASELHPIAILLSPNFGFIDILKTLNSEARLSITLSPQDYLACKEALEDSELPIHSVAEDGKLQSGHFELSWQDGGIIFDRARLETTYQELAIHYGFQSSQQDQSPEPTQTAGATS